MYLLLYMVIKHSFLVFVNLSGGDVTDVLRCQLFEQSGLPSVVQTQQQYPNLLVWCAL